MIVTINVPRHMVWVGGDAHDLSRAGIGQLLVYLMDNAILLWGWGGAGEYVFRLGVQS